ncbi:hypothetical protein HUU42_08275 [bacterium]|nr:hypothetical protein [bacterium]
MKLFRWLNIVFYALALNLFAQKSPVIIGERTCVFSKILNEERALLIYLPPHYFTTKASLPVMYLLDGEEHFHHATGVIEFLSRQNKIPPMIVVAIPNTQRTRDLTPKTESDNEVSEGGSADRFADFFADELIPYVDSTYRTQPFRLLIGHSFGGLFAFHTMFNRPELFNAFISISASLWWDNRGEIRKAENFFKDRKSFPKILYFTIGNEGDDMVKSNEAMSKILKSTPKDFYWKFTILEKESHGSIVHRSIYDGLEWMYRNWRLPENFESMSMPDIEAYYKKMKAKFGYEYTTLEAMTNAVGYALMGKGKIAQAVEVLKYNTIRFPDSPNVYDSLGEALEAAGQFDQAAINYLIAVERGTAVNDPNTVIFRLHYNNVMKKLGQ